jgi:hypothetical protein
VHGDAGTGGDDAQLLDGGRTLEVAGDEDGAPPLGREMTGELARDGRLARTLQAGEDDDGRRAASEVEGDVVTAERRTQLRVDGADDVLPRVESWCEIGADQPLAQPLDDPVHDGDVDVGLEQREPDVGERRVDRCWFESAATAQPVERTAEALLQNRRELMDELGKVGRVLAKRAGGIDETLLVLDGTVGQNGIAQAEAFHDAVEISGVAITKLDGSSRGGVVVAVQRQLGIPVKLVGLGEGIEDLEDFDPVTYVDGLLED